MSALESTAISQSRPADFIPGYHLEKLVGTGGMGEVHQATQLSLGRTVAVKLLNPELARDSSFVARFQKEAAALATLSHPHIVSIVDKGLAQGTYYLVMEFVGGPSLRERMRSPLDVPTALRMMVEICRAIDYAHGRGVIHRDLKPENILFDQQAGGLAKVTDFGLASFLDEGSGARFALTSTAVAMGTLSYMAPEQRVDARSADARADVYSLGVILYELLTGEVPMGTFDLPSRRRPGVDPRLDGIVTRCLKPDLEDRYPRVAALLADLEPMAPSLYTQPPPPPTRLQRLGRRLQRVARRTLQAALTLVVLAALGVLGVGYRLLTRERPAPPSPGAALATERLKPYSDLTMATGREPHSRTETHQLTVGEGPVDQNVSIAGRPVSAGGGRIRFPEVEDPLREGRALVKLFFPEWEEDPRQERPQPVGRAEVDLRSLEGESLSFAGRLRVDRPGRTLRGDLLALLQPSTGAAATMMLVGSSRGRYVALVYPADGSPLSLEWALGENSGTLTDARARSATPDEAALELTVSAEGVLEAFVGTGPERRRMGQPLHLGARWQEEFGAFPRPAFGCIETACEATGFTYAITRAPPPPPPPPPPGPHSPHGPPPPPPHWHPPPPAPPVAEASEPVRAAPRPPPPPVRAQAAQPKPPPAKAQAVPAKAQAVPSKAPAGAPKAQAVPAKATAKSPPAPVKQPAGKAPPPKPTRRTK